MAHSADIHHVTASQTLPWSVLAEIMGPMKTNERKNKNIAGSGYTCLPSLGNCILDHSLLTWGQLLLSLMSGGKNTPVEEVWGSEGSHGQTGSLDVVAGKQGPALQDSKSG